MASFKYKAFISYSHQDEATARWLHRALETYRPPRGVAARDQLSHSSAYPLRPIFRDQDELVASANLSNSLIEALQQSEFLIVICSPNSAQSHWTSQEIIEFKKIHGPDKVIAVIADGEPETCFPQPLLQEVLPNGEIGDSLLEPLAADLQGSRAERRLGLLKVAATMLGLDLDQLVQREAHRRHRFLATVATAAFVGMLVMGWLTYTAVNERRAADAARQVAEQAQAMAEQRRQEAEDLIEFMLGDLRDKLEPVGRLEVLDSVGAKALEYYASQDQRALKSESQRRRARALHLLGEISNLKGDADAALDRFTLAAESTGALLKAEPDNPQNIFEHAQSVFWVGYVAFMRGDFPSALAKIEQYKSYAQQLVAADPDNPKWQMELHYAHSNLGAMFYEMQLWEDAERNLLAALEVLNAVSGTDYPIAGDRATANSWLSSTYMQQLDFDRARKALQAEIGDYETLLEADPNNFFYRRAKVIAHRGLAQLLLTEGNAEGALKTLLAQRSELKHLVEFEPEDSFVFEQQVMLVRDIAEVYVLKGEFREAEELLASCLEWSSDLLRRDDSILFWKVGLDGHCRYLQAQAAFASGQYPLAARNIEGYFSTLLGKYEKGDSIEELPLLLADSSLLLGDLALAEGKGGLATEHWQRVEAILGADTDNMEPARIVSLAAALNRLGDAQRAQKILDYLVAAGYRHPRLGLI